MKRILISILVGSALLGLAACNDNNHTAPFSGNVRVVNGIADSGSISASATSGFSNTPGIGFDHASSTVTIPEGSYNVQLSNDNNHFATANNVDVRHNTLTVIYARGSIAGSTGSGFSVNEDLQQPSSGKFRFQFVNNSTQGATASLSIYLVAPGAGIGSATPVATAAAGAASDPVEVAAGSYHVIVTSGTTPLYDSGLSGSGIALPKPDTNVIQIGALDASTAQASADGSPLTLLILDNNGGEDLHLSGHN